MVKTIAMGMTACLVLTFLLIGCSGSDGTTSDLNGPDNTAIDLDSVEPSSIETFESADAAICKEDGKPIIRLFSTNTCPSCQWIADTYDAVVQQYVDDGEIVAHHWEINTGDDALTDQGEEGVPGSEMAIYAEFSPQDLVPTFVFGCKYHRVGNGHNNLTSEAAEFMAVIEALISE